MGMVRTVSCHAYDFRYLDEAHNAETLLVNNSVGGGPPPNAASERRRSMTSEDSRLRNGARICI